MADSLPLDTEIPTGAEEPLVELVANPDDLSEAKAAFPIGTIQVWKSGTYQKVTHGKVAPNGKKPNDWVLLTSKVKLPEGAAQKITYVPGSKLPPELAQFSFNPAQNPKKKAPAAQPAQQAPQAAAPAHAAEPQKKPEVQDPEQAKDDLKKQGSVSPDDAAKGAAQKAAADHPAEPEKEPEQDVTDPDDEPEDQPDEAPEEPDEVAQEPEQKIVEPPPPEAKQPTGILGIYNLPPAEEFKAAETPHDFHMWGIKLYQALAPELKLGAGSGPMAMIKALKQRADVVQALKFKYGGDWFGRYADAYLVFKADKQIGSLYHYNQNTNSAFNNVMTDLFDKNWFASYSKLKAGAEFGSVGAAPVLSDQPFDQVAAATPELTPAPPEQKPVEPPKIEKPVEAPKPPIVPMEAPPPPVVDAQKAAEADKLAKLVAHMDAAILKYGSRAEALKDANFVVPSLKMFGHGWLKKYDDAKQQQALQAQMQPAAANVDPIASAPPAVPQVGDLHAEPLKAAPNPPETTKSPDEAALVSDVDNYVASTGLSLPLFSGMVGPGHPLSKKYGGDWLDKYNKAKQKKDDSNQQAFLTDVEKELVNYGLNTSDIGKLTDFPGGSEIYKKLADKYGKFWQSKYLQNKKEQGGAQPPVEKDVSPGSQQALSQAQVVADLDKQMQQDVASMTFSQKFQDDPTLLPDHTIIAKTLALKYGADWRAKFKAAKEAAAKGLKATDAEAEALIKDAEVYTNANNPDPTVKIANTSLADASLKKKYGDDWKEKYKAAKAKQVIPQAVASSSVGVQQPSTASVSDLVSEIDKTLSASGVPFSVMAVNAAWKAKLSAKYGSDWEDKYKKAKNLTPVSTAPVPPVGSYEPAPKGDAGGSLIAAVDHELSSSGTTWDKLKKHPQFWAKMSAAFGANWSDDYEQAKKDSGMEPGEFTSSSGPAPGTGDLSFIQGENNKENLKSVVQTAIAKLVPKGYTGDPVEHLQSNLFFKLKMKKAFGLQWATNYKKAVGVYKKPGIAVPGEPTSGSQAAAKTVTIDSILSDIKKSQESLVPTLQAAIKKMYDADPSLWNHSHSNVLPDLMSHGEFDTMMTEKFGKEWKQTYEAITGVVPDAKPAEAFAGYVFPPMTDLKVSGSAKGIGGNKEKWFLKDQLGNTFLFKPSAEAPTRAYAGEFAAKVAALMFKDDGISTYVPVKAVLHPEKGFGSIQPFHADVKSTLAGIDLNTLNKDQLRSLMRERVVDWAIANHDTKAAQFVLMNDGSIKGTDKEQAAKFIGQDQLSLDYHPTGAQPPVYNDLFHKYADKEVDLDPNDVLSYIEKAEKTSDLEWAQMAEPYVQAAAEHNGADKAVLLKKILDRKKNLRSDFEKFFTSLKQKRGELKPGETFQFNTATQPKPMGPHDLPYANDLSYSKSAAHLGGAGYKDLYTDKSGKQWLFKLAQEKGGLKAKPYAAHVQAGFSKAATKVKPNHLPIGVTLLKTEIGTVQPYLDPPPPTLAGVEPKDLTFKEKISLAAEHILDWAGSQHDSHGKQLMRVNDEIIGIDKEQGFRFFEFGKGDKLSVEYHPNSIHGEAEPYYNKFWKDWKDGKFDFDPQTLGKYVDALDKIDDNEYVEGYKGYAQSLYTTDPTKQQQFLNAVLARKKSVRKDFESFITDLYKKKTKSEGFFTFKQGWKQGKSGIQVVKHVLKAKDSLGTDDYAGIAQKGYMDPDTGSADANKITLKLPKHQPVAKLQKFLDDFGLTPVMPIVTGSVNHITAVNKKDFDTAKVEKEEIIDTSLDAAPQPVSPHGFPHVPAHIEPKPNAHELHTIHQQKIGPGGKRLTIGGSAVENQVAKAIKYKDKTGKDYFLFNFKLLKHVWEPLAAGGKNAEYKIPLAKYDSDQGVYVEGGLTTKGITGSGEDYVASVDTKKWALGSSEIHISHDPSTYSFMGMVFAKIYPKAGQTPHEALTEALNKVKPNFADEILKDPTPEEMELVKLKRIAWATDPKGYAKLGSSPSQDQLKSLLLKKKMGDAHIEAVKLVETVAGHQTHVLPGRYKKLAGGTVKYLFNGISDMNAAFSVIQKGLLGINERALHGMELTGGSVSSDIESGSGDGILTRPVCEAGVKGSHQFSSHPFHGGFQAIIAPSELDRLDPYMYNGDTYGRCRDDFHGWTARDSIENTLSSSSHFTSAEVSFRKGINVNKLLRIVTSHQNGRQALIKECKKAGILEVNGVPIDEYVVVCTTLKEAYEKYVKPMGY